MIYDDIYGMVWYIWYDMIYDMMMIYMIWYIWYMIWYNKMYYYLLKQITKTKIIRSKPEPAAIMIM